MKHRIGWLVVGVLTSGAGVFAAACSSSNGDSFVDTDSGGDDSTIDQTSPDQGAGQDNTQSDAPADNAAADAPPDGDAGLFRDVGPLAKCSAVNGQCDIVSQNCNLGLECVPVSLPDGGTTTQCQQTVASEHLPEGHTCCPSQAGNPCLPGLLCIGSACDDAGNGGGRCTHACCNYPDGGRDDTPCGSSVPEGFPGHCDLNIVNGQSSFVLYSVCTYDQPCVPLHVEPCTAGNACLVQDMNGSANCVQIFGPPGLGEHQACAFTNECADGLACLFSGDAGVCLEMCYVVGQPTPFDAGLLSNTPGYGGCPGVEQCFSVGGFPTWLGACQ